MSSTWVGVFLGLGLGSVIVESSPHGWGVSARGELDANLEELPTWVGVFTTETKLLIVVGSSPHGGGFTVLEFILSSPSLPH